MTDDPLVDALLLRVGRDYLDALTEDELAAHVAATTDEGDAHRHLDDIAEQHGESSSHTTNLED
nr:hypothetical protein [Propionicimonas sp.]